MVFVSLGTQDKKFTRLLDIVSEAINQGLITEKVVVQAGYTKYESDVMEIYDYVSTDEFNKYIQDCSLLITHGGVGNILTGLKYNKKIIAVPRMEKYGEHTNDHQLQIVNNFADKGYVLKLEDDQEYADVFATAKSFKHKRWVNKNKEFIEKIRDYIDNN